MFKKSRIPNKYYCMASKNTAQIQNRQTSLQFDSSFQSGWSHLFLLQSYMNAVQLELPKLALNPIPFHSLGLLYLTKSTNDLPSSTCNNVCFVVCLVLLIYVQYL